MNPKSFKGWAIYQDALNEKYLYLSLYLFLRANENLNNLMTGII